MKWRFGKIIWPSSWFKAFRAGSLLKNISGVWFTQPALLAVCDFGSGEKNKTAERQQRSLVFTKSFLVLSFEMFDEVVVLMKKKLSHELFFG